MLYDPSELAELNAEGAGVFLMINEGDGNGRRAANVTRIRAYCADFDGAAFPEAWPLEPSMTVETSPGRFHAYWLLQEGEVVPLDNTVWNNQQAAIAQAVGSRPDDCKGLNRVMRVPGYLHQKGEAFTSRLLSSHGQRFTVAQIQRAFPLPVVPIRLAAPPPLTRPSEGSTPSTQSQIQRQYALTVLHTLADELSNTPAGERNNRLNALSFRAGRLIGGGHLERSEVAAELGRAAQVTGLADSEIRATLHSGLTAGLTEPEPLDHVGLKIIQPKARRSSDGSELGGSLPEIVVNERHLREIAEDAQAALLAANDPPILFQRGSELVRLAFDEGGARLKALDAVALKGRLARVADFVTVTERAYKSEDGKKAVMEDKKPARPPADLAPDLLAWVEHLGLPPLRTLARSPIYGPGGTLVSAEGYHAGSGIYMALRSLTVPVLPTVPDALILLSELLADFPFFPYTAGFAHTMAALLLPFVRPMIDGPTPLHLIEAPTRGSGKSLLAEVVAHITVGGPAGVMVQPKNGDEFEKRVTSILLEGASVVLLDNVHTLSGEALAAALTTPMWRGRRLGKSEMLTLPNGALWLATGNNVTLDDDMPRRIIPIRLDPGVERPEERSGFRHPNLLAWIKLNRPALVAACLSLVEAWKLAGEPRGTARLGGFESWAATIGGVLDVAGVPGFLTAREGLYDTANAEPQEWAALLADLNRRHGLETIGAREVYVAMRALDLCTDYWEGKQVGSALKRIGRAITQRRDRVFGQYRLRVAGKTGTGNLGYRVESVGLGAKKTPETPKTPESGGETAFSTAFLQNSASEQTPGVSGVFAGNIEQTPEKHRALHSVSDGAEGVSGVSGVLNPPHSTAGDSVEL